MTSAYVYSTLIKVSCTQQHTAYHSHSCCIVFSYFIATGTLHSSISVYVVPTVTMSSENWFATISPAQLPQTNRK